MEFTLRTRHLSLRRFLLGVVASILVANLASCTTEVNRREPYLVAEGFVEALAEGDLEGAKLLVTSDNWARLDKWFEVHKRVKCHSSAIGGVGDDPSLNIQTHRASYECLDEENPYCLSLGRIVLRKDGDLWQIIDWGDVTEAEDLWCP